MIDTDRFEFIEISAQPEQGRVALPTEYRDDFLRHIKGERVESQNEWAGQGAPTWRAPNGNMPMSPGMGLQTIVTEFGLRGITAVSYSGAWIAHDTTGVPGYFGDFSGTYTILSVRTRTQALHFLDGGVAIVPVLIETLTEPATLIEGDE